MLLEQGGESVKSAGKLKCSGKVADIGMKKAFGLIGWNHEVNIGILNQRRKSKNGLSGLKSG